MSVILRTEGIVKKFERVVANDGIDFELNEGELHALLGENGSGKSTFLNVLYGVWTPNLGRIFVKGREVKIKSPLDAIAKHKMGKVSQHSDLVPTLTVGENIVLRKAPRKYGFFTDQDAIRRKVAGLVKIMEVKIDPDSVVENLSTAEQQQVELLKILGQDAEIIFLDETSALLAPHEVDELFSLMRSLTERGRSIICVTHKLNEALRCDRITVLKKGQVTLKSDSEDVTQDELLKAMFGGSLTLEKHTMSTSGRTERPVLEVEGIFTGEGRAGRRSDLKDISFALHEGEILGIAGIAGNGQMELLDAITGACPPEKGRIILKGEGFSRLSSCRTLRKKNLIAYIPEDRQGFGSFSSLSICENMILGEGRRSFFFPRSIRNQLKVNDFAEDAIEKYEVKTAGIQARADSLSGGNLQKIILARELSTPSDLIIASQPSRGLDFKTTEFVHRKLLEKKEQGKAVLLVSYDLDEIMKLSDRVAVMFEGELMELNCREASTDMIGRIMVGIDRADDES